MNYFWKAVSSDGNSFDLFWLLAAATLKATVLLGFVALLCFVVRRFSAATRHLLWTLSLCAALLLPFLSVLAVWEVPIFHAQISSWSPTPANELTRTTDDAIALPEEGMQQRLEVSPQINESKPKISDFQEETTSVAKPVPVTNPSVLSALPQQSGAMFLSKLVDWALAIWLAGALLIFSKLLVGFLATSLLTRGAVEFKNPKLIGLFSSLLSELQLKGKVKLLRSERTLMPVVCGVFRPVILLPASADDWSDERRRMVLLHELTHVTRRDCLTQMLAQTACALYWFNPFVWHAARRLRVEREQACDDYVLSIGTRPSDYAHHLLEIARYLQERSVFQWSQTTTVAMARKSQLEGRLLAILSKEGKGRAMSQVMTAGVTALVFVLFLSLAVVRPTISSAQNPRISESALDETSAAEKSPSGLLLKKLTGWRDEAIAQGTEPRELSGTQENNANAGNISQEKLVNETQVDQEVNTVNGQNIESEVAETNPPQPESFPTPPAILETNLPIVPFINVKYQKEGKAEAQDKSVDFIDEMASVGYTNLTIKELVSLKGSGVTADYVRSLNALGLSHLTIKELSGLSANGVTPAFIQSIRNAGYKDLTSKELANFSVHGITPEFINKIRNAGYSNLSPKQLVDFGVHEVTPEFINSMRAVGFENLSPKELVTLRVHDITPEFVRNARKRLGDLTIKQIIALKINGLIEGSDDE